MRRLPGSRHPLTEDEKVALEFDVDSMRPAVAPKPADGYLVLVAVFLAAAAGLARHLQGERVKIFDDLCLD